MIDLSRLKKTAVRGKKRLGQGHGSGKGKMEDAGTADKMITLDLNRLPKTAVRGKKRLGQGHGSGKGKTAGRGTKGQNSRGKMSKTFSSGALAFIKRLPLTRGKYRNKSIKNKPLIVNIKYLNILPKNTLVDIDILIKHHVVKKDDALVCGVKILGDGEIGIPLTIKLPISRSAAKKIEAVGGKVINE